MLRLTISPAIGRRIGQFEATLDGEPVVVSHQPMADGARVLIERGHDPGKLATMRHAGNAHDSFKPMPLGYWAGVTYSEGETTPLRLRRWEARPDSVS